MYKWYTYKIDIYTLNHFTEAQFIKITIELLNAMLFSIISTEHRVRRILMTFQIFENNSEMEAIHSIIKSLTQIKYGLQMKYANPTAYAHSHTC